MKFLQTSRKVLARAKVQYALQRGLLVRLSCQICGQQKAQAHHEDYSRPLDVIWLCPQHHAQLHIELRRLRKISRIANTEAFLLEQLMAANPARRRFSGDPAERREKLLKALVLARTARKRKAAARQKAAAGEAAA